MVGCLESLIVEVSTFLQGKLRNSANIPGSEIVVQEGKGSGFPTLLMGRATGIIFLKVWGDIYEETVECLSPW